MKKKKVPMRMCIGCMEMKPKRELVRVVKTKADEITVDFTGRKPGRGAYLCNDIECLKKVKKTRRLEKAFETSISGEIFDALTVQVGDNNDGN